MSSDRFPIPPHRIVGAPDALPPHRYKALDTWVEAMAPDSLVQRDEHWLVAPCP